MNAASYLEAIFSKRIAAYVIFLLLAANDPGLGRLPVRAGVTDSLAQRNSARMPRSQYALLDGKRVHYRSSGRGSEALVFVHGWACDLTFWGQQVPDFESKTRLILIDLPGHGQSDEPKDGYTQDLFARAVDQVMQDLAVERAVLVGHSMGAQVIRQFYRKYPGKTLGLAVVDGFLWTQAKKEDFDKEVALYRGPKYREEASSFIDILFTSNTPAALREEIKSKMLRTPQGVLAGALESMADLTIYERDRIDAPLLAIYAKSAKWPPRQNEEIVRSIAKDIDYHEWSGVGHFIMLEEPKRFNDVLTAFLVKVGFLKNK
jgi:pimeloyl-ACP methyl ester carboxylesterase